MTTESSVCNEQSMSLFVAGDTDSNNRHSEIRPSLDFESPKPCKSVDEENTSKIAVDTTSELSDTCNTRSTNNYLQASDDTVSTRFRLATNCNIYPDLSSDYGKKSLYPLLNGVQTPANFSLYELPILYCAISSLEKSCYSSIGKMVYRNNKFSARRIGKNHSMCSPPSQLPSSKTTSTRYSSSGAEPTKKVDNRMAHHNLDTAILQNIPSNEENIEERSSIDKSIISRGSDVCDRNLNPRIHLPHENNEVELVSKYDQDSCNLATKRIQIFRLFSDAYTPRVNNKEFKFKPAESRDVIVKEHQDMGTLSRPNCLDALKRVSIIIKQHIIKIEQRLSRNREVAITDGLFRESMIEAFADDRFSTPRFKCTFMRLAMAHPGMIYGLRRLSSKSVIPSEGEIYEFGQRLFEAVQLSSECSIICLIYMERLMEKAKVPLVVRTWKPIFLCGLLLASKVWQDMNSWNIEFSNFYPQYSLHAINQLESQFLKYIKWDLYISGSLYAKYYFALRSILGKKDFRNRYNRMVAGVDNAEHAEANRVQLRSAAAKEMMFLHFSRSM
jgi:Cyclin, N-terminal domain